MEKATRILCTGVSLPNDCALYLWWWWGYLVHVCPVLCTLCAEHIINVFVLIFYIMILCVIHINYELITRVLIVYNMQTSVWLCECLNCWSSKLQYNWMSKYESNHDLIRPCLDWVLNTGSPIFKATEPRSIHSKCSVCKVRYSYVLITESFFKKKNSFELFWTVCHAEFGLFWSAKL